MKISQQYGKYLFGTSAALLLTAGSIYPVVAAEPEPFTAVSTLCAISPNVLTPPDQKGNHGVLVQTDMTYIYRNQALDDQSLMNAWENHTNNWKQTPRGVEFYWGHNTNIPDDHAGTGTLEEDFKFKASELADGITGVLQGTGDLEGVTIEYELTPPNVLPASEYPVECYGYVALCPECFPAITPGPDGIPGTEDDEFYQYDFSGWIEGYTP
jgi:hypothetical protein